jgi:hypothetical protein
MYRTVGGVLALLLALPALAAADKPKDQPTPEEQYKALLKEQQDAMRAFSEAYSQAKTQEEKNKVFNEKYPQPDKLAPKFLALAEKHAKDPVAVDALVWVVTNSSGRPGGTDSPRAKALTILLRDHAQSDKIKNVCQSLAYSSDKEATDLLRRVMEKNPSKDVQGLACLSLAHSLKYHADRMPESQAKEAEKLHKESEQLFERAADKYADVVIYSRKLKDKTITVTVGDRAKGGLFEVRFLAIGKVVPEVEGEDADSKTFKLSDYRGKVVLIDFWGQW